MRIRCLAFLEVIKIIRLQKYMADCGVASRRKAEEYILAGRVRVNGDIVDTLGFKVTPDDVVAFDGKPIIMSTKNIYAILNKPIGVVTTVSDKHGRQTVMDLIKIKDRIFPVGRLDMDTEGLILMTNDGALTYSLTHPKHSINKEYVAQITGSITNEVLHKLSTGIMLDGRLTAPAVFKRMKTPGHVKIIIHEGRNRQIRRMFAEVGHRVVGLKRVAIGNIKLGPLTSGHFRYLTEKELEYIKNL